MMMLVKLSQFLNAPLPMLVTLLGMVMVVRFMQPLKRVVGIVVKLALVGRIT
jgi:hypothetical protein